MKGKFLLLCCLLTLKLFAQNDSTVVADTTVVDISNEVDSTKKWTAEEPSLKVFYGQRLINANTVEVLRKGVMEFRVIHNFYDIGGSSGGLEHFFGLDNAADIKIGFQIGLGNRLNILAARTRGDEGSVGDTVFRVGPVQQLWELGLKYQFLKQEKDSKHPFSMTVYANTVVSSMKSIGGLYKESTFNDFSDRMSQLVQLMIARRFGDLSLQISPTYVHTNYVLPQKDDKSLFALGGGVRLPLTKKFFLIADYFHTFRSEESKDFLKSHNIPLHDMHNHIYIINQHPLEVFHALVPIGNFTAFLFYLLLYKIRNRPDLRLIACLTDYKKIGYGFRYFAQVERNDVLSFFLLNCLDNGFNDL